MIQLTGLYFRTWRRKLGVLVLVIALPLAAAWMRSRSTIDDVVFWSGPHTRMSISSIDGYVRWGTHFEIPEEHDEFLESELKPFRWASEPMVVGFDVIAGTIGTDGQINWRWLGFCLCEASLDENCRDSYLFIPYWSIVAPLTLASGLLLLSKLKPAKPITEPSK